MDRRASFAFLSTVIERSSSLIVGLVVIGFVGLNVAMLSQLRMEAWNKATAGADNVLRLLQDELSQATENYAEGFQIVATQLALVDDRRRTGTYEEAVIGSVSSLVRSTGDLFLFNENGEISQRSHRVNAREALKHRTFLTAHRSDPSTGIRIGSPFRDPVTGNTVLWISRRLERADGSFSGVVAATLNTGRWRNLFHTYAGGPESAINLFHTDGTLMMRMPFLADKIGTNFSETRNFRIFASTSSGDFVANAAIDNVERAFRFAHVPGTPLILNVAIATDEIYAGWWRVALSSSLVVCVLALMAFALKRVVGRELLLRRESEKRYRALSSLDGLTGVANRRAFDEALQAEWAASMAEDRSVAVILLDVDFFKSFNDIYGHQVGDDCLRRVAAAVDRAVSRAGDLVARYGGEEFVVLLRGTDGAGALVVAERVRAAVEALNIVHAGQTATRCVTVSIGTASVPPAAEIGATASLLVSAADRALYRAKRTGRNRVEREIEIVVGPEPRAASDEAARSQVAERHLAQFSADPRQPFDELASLAASALQAPIAMVSLIGTDRYHAIGRSGTEIETLPRSQSFCAHAILGEGVFVVPDATLDPRFSSNPLVAEDGGIRFYAGAPIVSPGSDVSLGTVCVVDTVPRTGITRTEQHLLATLAEVASRRFAAAGGASKPTGRGLRDSTAGNDRDDEALPAARQGSAS